MYDSRTDETVFGASYDFVELYLNYLNMEESEKEKILNEINEDNYFLNPKNYLREKNIIMQKKI